RARRVDGAHVLRARVVLQAAAEVGPADAVVDGLPDAVAFGRGVHRRRDRAGGVLADPARALRVIQADQPGPVGGPGDGGCGVQGDQRGSRYEKSESHEGAKLSAPQIPRGGVTSTYIRWGAAINARVRSAIVAGCRIDRPSSFSIRARRERSVVGWTGVASAVAGQTTSRRR